MRRDDWATRWLLDDPFDQADVQKAKGILHFITNSSSVANGTGQLCLTCETEFTLRVQPAAFLIASPGLDAPNAEALVMVGICRDCEQHCNPEQLLQKGYEWIKGHLLDDAEILNTGNA